MLLGGRPGCHEGRAYSSRTNVEQLKLHRFDYMLLGMGYRPRTWLSDFGRLNQDTCIYTCMCTSTQHASRTYGMYSVLIASRIITELQCYHEFTTAASLGNLRRHLALRRAATAPGVQHFNKTPHQRSRANVKSHAVSSRATSTGSSTKPMRAAFISPTTTSSSRSSSTVPPACIRTERDCLDQTPT